jgi:hypothetical protein
VNHDRSHKLVTRRVVPLSSAVVELESLRELEVELDRRALVLALEGVLDGDVDLGAVESTVSRVDVPLARDELVEGLGKHLGRPREGQRVERGRKKWTNNIQPQPRPTSRPYQGTSPVE